MTPRPDPDRAPDPELLAAYGDGELDQRPELRRRIEAWLARHPEACALLDEQRRLRELWQETTPLEPQPQAWHRVFGKLHETQSAPPGPTRQARARFAPAAAMVAAASVALLIWGAARLLQPTPSPAPQQTSDSTARLLAQQILPVANDEEVVILRIEGDDTQTVMVGQLPVQGPLELADSGEVEQISSKPAARDQMVPQFRLRGRPMIWARLESDDD
jgi:anti-sigma factor RsiW